jgi:glycosyltransferase involved in cell wall biosynthesis
MKEICCIFNYAPHYRSAVYKLMDEQLNCRFYFGSKVKGNIRKMDYNGFKKEVKELNSIWFFNRMYWIAGSVNLLFKPTTKYLLTGETICLSNWATLLFSKIVRKKVYVWGHGWYGKESRFQTIVKKFYFSLCDGVFLYGNYAKQLMISNGINENKLHVIYNSLDYQKTKAIRNQLKKTGIYQAKFLNKNPVLIFIGRVEPVKKLNQIIEVLLKMRMQKMLLNLVIVGDGSQINSLKSAVEKAGISEQVWFYGQTYEEQVIGELMYNADLCISPGNVGLTAIHSLSYGTPIITHNNFPRQMPEFEAIESGITGDFFEEEDVDSLRAVIEKWLIKHKEKDEKLIEACYKRVNDFYNPGYQVQVLKNGMGL